MLPRSAGDAVSKTHLASPLRSSILASTVHALSTQPGPKGPRVLYLSQVRPGEDLLASCVTSVWCNV